MLAIFDAIPFRQAPAARTSSQVSTLRRIYGLEWGIENSIISDLLYHGDPGDRGAGDRRVALFLTEVARDCRRGVWLPILAFVILVNTFEGLAGKTTMLAKFALMLVVLFPPSRSARSRA